MGGGEFYAHRSNTDDRHTWHSLSEHLRETGRRAAEFLTPIGAAEIAKTAGMLHDLGKYTDEFQRRLEGDPRRVDHSTAGAKVAFERFGPLLGKVLAFCIAGHHAGLANGASGERITDLDGRLRQVFGDKIPHLDGVWQDEITLAPSLAPPAIRPKSQETAGFSAAFFTRMLFSALVDADYLDTEGYFADLEGQPVARGDHPELPELRARLEAYLTRFAAEPSSAVNALRARVLEHVRHQAAQLPGLFTLTVPTGGGKTLTSLAFALDHAIRYGQKRVVYIIPFTSIIEQTASTFRDALGEDGRGFILEHHSAFEDDAFPRRDGRDKLRLAMENWDAPIVVTTAVQFFESLFANRPSRCRKLHNVANSVVILDEAQTLPLALLRPCVAVLDELARNYRASIVLCTATQPALLAPEIRGGFENVREIAPDPRELYQTLKRTRIHNLGVLDDDELASRLRAAKQVLCIVNTRRHARELHGVLADSDGARHLTTLMCARHRAAALQEIRTRLNDRVPVRLIATSLIEAGVDIDFPVVYRAAAGIDSIAQAAGRCNRNGCLTTGNVYVFEPPEIDGRRPPPEIRQFAAAARTVLRRHDDPLTLEAINDFFQEIYWLRDSELDAKSILTLIRERADTLDFPFETIASLFRVIETPLVPVIVSYRGPDGSDESVDRLVERLRHADRIGGIARRLQPYIVQIPRSARTRLIAAGAAEIIRRDDYGDQFIWLLNEDLYSVSSGLSWDEPAFRQTEGLIL